MPNKSGDSKEYIWGEKRNKKWIIIVIAAVVVVGAVLGYIIFGFKADKKLENANTVTNTASQSALVRRALDGVYVPAAQANHYPAAVMIENLVVARPQSNLAKANLVYEALAEGGITRFLAIFSGELTAIPEIGPVRSARPYYLDWVAEYNALYLHAGGSPQAMSDIKKYGILDLDQFFNSQYYWRDKKRPAAIEHTLYSSGEKIAFALRDKKIENKGQFATWQYKEDATLANRPSAEKNVSIDFSSFNYKVEYKYNRENNDYLRYQAGEVHKDKDGAEIRVKNVVVQKVKAFLVDKERLGLETVGEGEAIIFRDGQAIVGRWKKADRKTRTLFYDDKNEQIEFNAGATWIEAVPTDRDVIYN